MAFEQCFRPSLEAERASRALVRALYPAATSAYVQHGAIVYDDSTAQVLGRASCGDWAVDIAWLDAAAAVSKFELRKKWIWTRN